MLASFWKPEARGQTVLPDRSILTGQKLVKNAKIQKFKCHILSNFQTLWSRLKSSKKVSMEEVSLMRSTDMKRSQSKK